ncbi:MAG: hypothetical protein ACKPKO_26195 [Candidatus Fonsibacter sp.]
MNYIEEFVSNTVCTENSIDLLDERIGVDDEDGPYTKYSVSFITSTTSNNSYINRS